MSWVVGNGVDPPGIGVPSLLGWVAWKLELGEAFFAIGTGYVWPVAGVKCGKEDAVDRSLVSDVTVES